MTPGWNPPEARILEGQCALIACASAEPGRRTRQAGGRNCRATQPSGELNLPALSHLLADRGINELLVRPASGLNGSLVGGLVSMNSCFIWRRPCSARTVWGVQPPEIDPPNASKPNFHDIRQIGVKDLRIVRSLES